jgi:hypothetical protein
VTAFRTSAAGGGTSGSSNRTSTAFSPAVGDLWLVFGHFTTNANLAPTCTDNNGGTYTLIFAGLRDSSTDMFCGFVRDQPFVNTTSTTCTVATGSNDAGAVGVLAFSGSLRYGARAIRQWAIQENQAATGTPGPAFAIAALTGSATIAGCANATATGSILVPNASWTERMDAAQSTPTTGLEVATRDSGFTGTTITAGGTSATAFGSFCVELWATADDPNFLLTGCGGP